MEEMTAAVKCQNREESNTVRRTVSVARIAALGLWLLSAACVAAPDITLRGFGTLGAVHNFSDDVETIRELNQPDGPRGETSFDVDSRLGVQLDVAFSSEVSASFQAISRYNYRGKYTPYLSRAFLKYRFFNNYEVRLGRMGWDVYSLADSRNVGYALLWVRPPLDYFGNLQLDKIDGMDFSFSHLRESGLLSGKLYAGVASEEIAVDDKTHVDLDGTFVYGGHLAYHFGNWMTRLSASRLQTDAEIHGEQGRQLEALVNSGDPVIIELLRQAGLIDIETEIGRVAMTILYDSGPLTMQLMASRDNYINAPPVRHNTLGFLTLGYRMGDWTPYASYSRVRTSAGEPATGPFAANAEAVIQDQQTFSAGVRYDFHPNMALKIQADHHDVEPRGRNSILWRAPDDDWNGRVNQVSVTLDFIF